MAAKTKTRRIYVKSKRTHHKAKFTIPLAVVAGFAPGVIDSVNNGTHNGWTSGADSGLSTFLGDFMGIQTQDAQKQYHTGAFSTWRLKYGLYPVIAGFAIHWGAQKFGVNRMLARANIPLIRI
jgi:hypothetical protein